MATRRAAGARLAHVARQMAAARDTPTEIIGHPAGNTLVDPALTPGPQAPFVAKLLIVAFALSYLSGAAYLVADCWVHDQGLLKSFLRLPASYAFTPVFLSATYTVLGAILGAGVLDIVSFHHYVAVKRDFQSAHVWGYFIGPWLAAVLGLVIYALLQTGLLVFSGGSPGGGQNGAPADPASEVSHLGYLAVGFLSGFGWYQAVGKIREIVGRFFGAAAEETKQQTTATVLADGGGAMVTVAESESNKTGTPPETLHGGGPTEPPAK